MHHRAVWKDCGPAIARPEIWHTPTGKKESKGQDHLYGNRKRLRYPHGNEMFARWVSNPAKEEAIQRVTGCSDALMLTTLTGATCLSTCRRLRDTGQGRRWSESPREPDQHDGGHCLESERGGKGVDAAFDDLQSVPYIG